VTLQRDRFVTVTNCVNFRDLGGYPALRGRTIRYGTVFRSDALHRVSTPSRLTSELGVRTAIDLRMHDEVERSAHLIRALGCHHVHLPILDETRLTPRPVNRNLVDLYRYLLDVGAPNFAEAIRVIADKQHHPVVFFCASGKDRTGLLAALLLGLLGVHERDIIDDYALTQQVLTKLAQAKTTHDAVEPSRAGLPPQYSEAAPDTMREVLHGLRAEHGSIVGYAESIGIDRGVRDALHDALLTAPIAQARTGWPDAE
jgi:protein-tyrosine phosphatase